MFDFNEIVNTLLLEADPVTGPDKEATPEEKNTASDTIKKSPWFQKIIAKHAELKYGQIDDKLQDSIIQVALTQYPTDTDILRIFGGIRVYDTLVQILNTRKSGTAKVAYINEPDFAKNGDLIANKIASLQPGKWGVTDPENVKRYERVKGSIDKQAAIALNTYNNLSIFDATQQIVKRRTDLLSRIANLKNPSQPFAKVITDIFQSPEQYLSGQKAVSTDFSDLVDGLYVKDIINIAVAAKDFYATELDTLKNSTAVDRNTYRKRGEGGRFVKAPVTPETQRRLKEIKQNTQAYLNFINNKPVQYNVITKKGTETGEVKTTEPGAYTIGKIQEIETPEAVALISALRSIAQYDRTKPGVSQRMAGAQQALQGVAAFGGAKLYT